MRSLSSLAALSGAALLAVFALAVRPAAAQSGAAAPATPQAAPSGQFPTGTAVVALDIVVRDKKGKLVTDLAADEVTVLEDGVAQKVTAFVRPGDAVAPAGPGATAAAAAGAPGPAAPGTAPAAAPSRVVLVFGRLGSNARRLAQGAGEEFAKRYVDASTIASVLRIDGAIVPLLDKSSDPAAVREGVRQATALVAGAQKLAGGPVGSDNSYAGQQMGRFQGGAGEQDLSQADSLAFLSSLATLVDGLAAEPGRKSVLVFSEGFSVPPGYEHVFAGLLSRANRANVAFYAIDVRGLQLSAQLEGSGAALATAAAMSESQRDAANVGVTRSQATQDDTMLSSFRADVVDTMRQLSSATGGFLVTQTNDFGRPLARIDEDRRGYYQASYVPPPSATPGQFRRIEVRVARKDVRVQARHGYYTSPPVAAGAAALAALSAEALPSDLELRSRFYHFGRPEAGAPSDCLIKTEVSLARAEFKESATAKGRFAARIAFAGRVLRPTGDVVETFGQDVALGGTPEQVEAARAQTLPLARRLKLAPGNYTAEVVVRDDASGRAGAMRLPLTVPDPQGGLAMSSLVVVAGLDPVDPKADATDPLRLGDKRIVPNLGRPVPASASPTVPIYYLVYVKPGAAKEVRATVEVSRGGSVLARGSSPLPAADESGRITGLSPIPVQKLAAGVYTVKVTVSDGEHSADETAELTIGS